MGYKENIRRTQIELAVSIQRQSSWPNRIKPARWAMLNKLHKYSRQVGNCVFDHRATPENLGVNVGYAGKKRKAKMLEVNSFHLGTKRPKVSRRFENAFTFGTHSGLRIVCRDKAVPDEPLEPFLLDGVCKVLVLCNHKKGSFTFFNRANEAVLKIPYVCDDTLSGDQAIEAWKDLTTSSRTGEGRPFFREAMIRRQAPDRATGEAAAVRTGEL